MLLVIQIHGVALDLIVQFVETATSKVYLAFSRVAL